MTLPLKRTAPSNTPQLLLYEAEAKQNGYTLIAGIDEAGRGPLAGPVTAAACLLSEDTNIAGLNDSKKLSADRRRELFLRLTQDPTIIYSVGVADPELIDQVNILQATIRAMQNAVDGLTSQPDYLLVDGLKLPHPSIPSQKLIKGDTLSASIMAAAIIAKETRDLMMLDYDRQWPEYGFAKHKGYGTAEHREAIEQYGPCPIHRRSFEPVKSMLK